VSKSASVSIVTVVHKVYASFEVRLSSYILMRHFLPVGVCWFGGGEGDVKMIL